VLYISCNNEERDIDNVTVFLCVSQNVLDGDLCEMFNALDASKQKTVAEELDRTPSEVLSSPVYLLVR